MKLKIALTGLIMASAQWAMAAEPQMMTDSGLLIMLSSLTALLLVVFLVLARVIKSMASSEKIIELIRSKNKGAGVVLLFILLGASTPAHAASGGFVMTDDLLWAFVSIDILLIFFILYEIYVIRKIIRMASIDEEGATEESKDFVVAGIKLTDRVPVEREEEVMFDHEYDGIRELDNNLPPWWVYGFYLTILFSFVYIGYYHVFGGPSSAEAYEQEMEEARIEVEAYVSKLANRVDETNVTQLMDAGDLSAGKEVYELNCKACHGALGEGGTGPTFADKHWIHGGGITNIFTTVKYGVPAKGMISWEPILSPQEMQQVASYIMTFEGTNPPGMKDPQGDVWTGN